MGFLRSIMNTFNRPDPVRFEALKAIVRRHVADYAAVGTALAEIHEKHLYRLQYDTWDNFLRIEYDMTTQHAGRLMRAAEVARKTEPMGSVPKTEHLARPIAALPEEDQVEAWQDAITIAGGAEPTMEHVAAAVAKRKPTKAKPQRLKALRLKVAGGLVELTPGRGFKDFPTMLREAADKLEQKAKAA